MCCEPLLLPCTTHQDSISISEIMNPPNPIPVSINTYVSRLVLRELGIEHGFQDRVLICQMFKYGYARWFSASVFVERLLGHRNFRIAEDHLGGFCFILQLY
ncbi:hypothetical protein ACP70R_029139 [Stipagrostis hirtigluma subsp. patula]